MQKAMIDAFQSAPLRAALRRGQQAMCNVKGRSRLGSASNKKDFESKVGLVVARVTRGLKSVNLPPVSLRGSAERPDAAPLGLTPSRCVFPRLLTGFGLIKKRRRLGRAASHV